MPERWTATPAPHNRIDAVESLAERLARLERERLEADRAYNDALTALDGALGELPDEPTLPAGSDGSQLPVLNERWNILSGADPAIDRSLKGRLRGLVWRLVAPVFEQQRRFNSALVDHINRNAGAQDETRRALGEAMAVLRANAERVRVLHAHLIQYLQRVTLYVDTKDRAMASGADVLNEGLSAITDDFLKRWESQSVREQRASVRLQQLAANVDEARAAFAIGQQTVLSLKRDVERLLSRPLMAGDVLPEPIGAPATDLNAFKYLAFENAFRGAPALIRGRLEGYVPLFLGQSDVLDVGCGRGEFLDLLRTAGISGRGVDLNQAMVEEARARGFDARCTDALTYLRGLPDTSLGGVFAAQVVEHLQPDYLAALIEVAAQKLRPGGRLVLETINPSCWVAFFESYLRDLTHVRPIHPETLQYLVRVSGFTDVQLRFSSPVAPEHCLQRADIPTGADRDLVELATRVNENIDRLNGRMFSFQDYAAIATRP
ncbi:MAG: class I SAM-dependent methyltransferase [Acidobacteriota bacterium]